MWLQSRMLPFYQVESNYHWTLILQPRSVQCQQHQLRNDTLPSPCASITSIDQIATCLQCTILTLTALNQDKLGWGDSRKTLVRIKSWTKHCGGFEARMVGWEMALRPVSSDLTFEGIENGLSPKGGSVGPSLHGSTAAHRRAVTELLFFASIGGQHNDTRDPCIPNLYSFA